MRHTGPTKKTVEAVIKRAGYHCERCGRGKPEQIHHRKPRGSGGTSDPAINSPSNLLALCSTCHAHIESHRAVAYEQGWLVRRIADPAKTPVWLFGWGFVFLTDHGDVEIFEESA